MLGSVRPFLEKDNKRKSNMKRLLLLLLTVLSTVACKKITTEERISQIADYFDKQENTFAGKLEGYEGQKRLDYLTLTLVKELGAGDLWTLENGDGASLVAEFPGKSKQTEKFSVISASLDDPAGCAVALEVIQALKKLKIRPENGVRVLFYSLAQDSTGRTGLGAVAHEFAVSDEMITYDLELTACDSLAPRTFRVEDRPVFAKQLMELFPPYFEPLGDYHFEKGKFPNPNWPLRTTVYRYAVTPGELKKDAAAVTTFAYLLN